MNVRFNGNTFDLYNELGDNVQAMFNMTMEYINGGNLLGGNVLHTGFVRVDFYYGYYLDYRVVGDYIEINDIGGV